MFVNYDKLRRDLIGIAIEGPSSGTLSGHAIGEPFDKLVSKCIKEQFPKNTFRQFEYLNFLFSKNKDAITTEARYKLFNSPTIMFLLSRGKSATEQWSPENLFQEKQNDTADILVTKDDRFELIDVKTRNLSKNAQPPNIISAYKLAQTCAKMIDNQDFELFDIVYFQIDWEQENNFLIRKDTSMASLFLSNPSELYINWAAAMQIQFHVNELNQDYKGNKEEWSRHYLKHFTDEARNRSNMMINKFVKPFEKYIY